MLHCVLQCCRGSVDNNVRLRHPRQSVFSRHEPDLDWEKSVLVLRMSRQHFRGTLIDCSTFRCSFFVEVATTCSHLHQKDSSTYPLGGCRRSCQVQGPTSVSADGLIISVMLAHDDDASTQHHGPIDISLPRPTSSMTLTCERVSFGILLWPHAHMIVAIGTTAAFQRPAEPWTTSQSSDSPASQKCSSPSLPTSTPTPPRTTPTPTLSIDCPTRL